MASSAAAKEEVLESQRVEDTKGSVEHAVGFDTCRQNVDEESLASSRRMQKSEE